MLSIIKTGKKFMDIDVVEIVDIPVQEINVVVLYACLMRASRILKDLSNQSDKDFGYLNPASSKLYRAALYVETKAAELI